MGGVFQTSSTGHPPAEWKLIAAALGAHHRDHPPQCANAGNGLQDCTDACTCACPRLAPFEPDATDPGSRIDVGFSGFGHGAPVLGNALVTVWLGGGTSGVPGLRDPNCGVMTVGGPIENPLAGAGQLAARRCSVEHSIR